MYVMFQAKASGNRRDPTFEGLPHLSSFIVLHLAFLNSAPETLISRCR